MLRPVACVNECGGVAEGLVHLYKGAREGLVPLIDTIDNRYGLGAGRACIRPRNRYNPAGAQPVSIIYCIY